MMRIAVTYDNGNIFQHFGHTQQFKLYDVEDGKVVNSAILPTGGFGHGALAGFLRSHGVDALASRLPSGYRPEILSGREGYAALASLPEVDMVLSAQVGAAGLRATVAAALAGKTVCLANKESLVLAGELIRNLCARTGAVILPVDSEHCALFESMAGRREGDIARLILTASGGPFRGKSREFMEKVRPQDALKHPSWSMGAKITIDSATLMNKGLEVIEAFHLYQVPVKDIEVVVHPQSVVHSLVELADGSLIGQLAVPDMRVPIAACLSWPYLLDEARTGIRRLHLADVGSLTFEEPRRDLFFPERREPQRKYRQRRSSG